MHDLLVDTTLADLSHDPDIVSWVHHHAPWRVRQREKDKDESWDVAGVKIDGDEYQLLGPGKQYHVETTNGTDNVWASIMKAWRDTWIKDCQDGVIGQEWCYYFEHNDKSISIFQHARATKVLCDTYSSKVYNREHSRENNYFVCEFTLNNGEQASYIGVANRFLRFVKGDKSVRAVQCHLYSCADVGHGLFKVPAFGSNRRQNDNFWGNYMIPLEVLKHKVYRCDNKSDVQYFVKYRVFSRVLGGQDMDDL